MQHCKLVKGPRPPRIAVRIYELWICKKDQMMRRCILGLHSILTSASFLSLYLLTQRKLTHLSQLPHSHPFTAPSKTHLSPHSKTNTHTTTKTWGKLSSRLGCHLSQCLRLLGMGDALVETEAHAFRSHRLCVCAMSPDGRPAITRERREGGSTKWSRVEREAL
jgi:hypothetical protein